ncbi:hypothetical protein TSAR_013608 [Trichomalopsis sarcophagae]|uniref:Uncharacterized protein n=1 Tax=Trichomalopsis sarcophagae TaxID=543379 RepID=A0A232EWX3_9HYME|nr:hypothetical protein TSAR_013608 [Trichomalopsis sarcophagae]
MNVHQFFHLARSFLSHIMHTSSLSLSLSLKMF